MSEIVIKKLDRMRVASYVVISKNPEEEVISYMNQWLTKNGLDNEKGSRAFGFNVPVSEEQEKQGIRGYEYWVTVPMNANESEGIKIKDIAADEYAVLKIVDPFSNPFDTIPNAWKELVDWVMNSEYKSMWNENRYALEEVIEDENGTYMYIYFPVKEGCGKVQAELIKFLVGELEPSKIIGKEIVCKFGHPNGNPIPAFWGKCFEDGSMKILQDHPDRIYKNASLGWMGNFNKEESTFSYIVGVLAKPNAKVPEGMSSVNLPKTLYGVGTIKGSEPEIYMNASYFTENEIKKSDLKIKLDNYFEMEWYDERFCESKEYKVIDLYMPVEE